MGYAQQKSKISKQKVKRKRRELTAVGSILENEREGRCVRPAPAVDVRRAKDDRQQGRK